MTSKFSQKFLSQPKNILLVGMIALALVIVVGLGGVIFNRISDLAKANSQVTLYPGQIGEFTVYYINAGDTDVSQANVTIDIGPKLQFIPGSIREYFGTETNPRCVSDNVVTYTPVGNGQAATISYVPRSSNAISTTQDCTGVIAGGLSGVGASNIPPALSANPSDFSTWPADKTGRIVFRAKLRDNNTDQPGYVIGASVLDPAVNAQATFDGRNGGQSNAQVVVARTPINALTNAEIPGLTISCNDAQTNSTTTCTFTLPTNRTLPTDFRLGTGDATPAGTCTVNGQNVTCTNVPTGSPASTDSSNKQPIRARIGTNPAVDSGEKINILNTSNPLTPSDYPNLDFVCNPAQTNSTTTCTFTLPTNRTLPTDFRLGIGNSTPAGLCTANGQNVTCTNVPTGSQAGQQPINAQIGTNSSVDTGDRATVSAPVPAGQNNLYFIGMDNAPACYDPIVRYNTCYNRTQKFRDGPVTLVFDNLKGSNGQILTSGTCTFNLSRHPKDQNDSNNILKTYTAPVNNGKCTAIMPVADQTVNYYMVTASVPDGSNVIRDASILILYVGG